jgi:uncharacterized protein (TIGR02246 family)
MRSLAFVAFAISFASEAYAAEPAPADRQQLMQLAERMDHAWTAGDAEANAQLFAVDATARFGNDRLAVGREEILAQFRSFFNDRPAGLRHVTKIERVERLNDELAMWDAEVRVEGQRPPGQWVALTTIRNVTIAARQREGWRIKSVRAFPVSP